MYTNAYTHTYKASILKSATRRRLVGSEDHYCPSSWSGADTAGSTWSSEYSGAGTPATTPLPDFDEFFSFPVPSENENGEEVSSSDSGEDKEKADLHTKQKVQPEKGMLFSSEKEAYKFYNRYAKGIGFTVRRGKVQRLRNGDIRKRNFLCSREGFRSGITPPKLKRKETRTGCRANIQLTVEDGKWIITNFVTDHNHELDKPLNNRGFEEAVPLGLGDGTGQSVGLSQPDFANNSLRQEDIQSLLDFLSDLNVEDQFFSYAVQIRAEKHITNFFWTDYRSRMDYEHFGDVVVFGMSLPRGNAIYYAPFWGVNHHRQRVLFGCAILVDEALDTFVWLFKRFMAAMGNRQPKTFFSTVESRAIASAVGTVFPEARHRFPVNSIRKNAEKHLSAYFEQPGFECLFNKCVTGCRSETEFESHWGSLLERYSLWAHPWLDTLFELRDKWSPASGKQEFSAGVEYASFELFQCPNNEIAADPTDFVRMYVGELKQRRSEEVREDWRSGAIVETRSMKGMEKHAADVYTRAVFEKFQAELIDSLSLAIEEIAKVGDVSTFRLCGEGQDAEDVAFDASASLTIMCSCGKFKSEGILCGHSIRVLNTRNIFQIPSHYILKRWTKAAKAVSVDETRHETLPNGTEVESYLDAALACSDIISKKRRQLQVDSEAPMEGHIAPNERSSHFSLGPVIDSHEPKRLA